MRLSLWIFLLFIQVVLGFDWNLCTQIVCFVPSSCLGQTEGKLVQLNSKVKDSFTCLAAIAFRPFSKFNWGVYIHADTNKVDKRTGVSLKVEGAEGPFITCSHDGTNVTISSDPYPEYSPRFIDDSSFDNDQLECTFIYKRKTPLGSANYTLQYTKTDGQQGNDGNDISSLITAGIKCDPHTIDDLKHEVEGKETKEVYFNKLQIDCSNYEGFTLMYELSQTLIPAIKVVCDKRNGSSYGYTLYPSNSKQPHMLIPIGTKFTLYCAKPIPLSEENNEDENKEESNDLVISIIGAVAFVLLMFVVMGQHIMLDIQEFKNGDNPYAKTPTRTPLKKNKKKNDKRKK